MVPFEENKNVSIGIMQLLIISFVCQFIFKILMLVIFVDWKIYHELKWHITEDDINKKYKWG